MDTAPILRLAAECGELPEENAAREMLERSGLVRKLTADFVEHPTICRFSVDGVGGDSMH